MRQIDNTLVIVFTNKCYAAVINGAIHQEHPLYSNPYELLLSYQNTSSGIYIDLMMSPLVAYKDVIKTVDNYIKQESKTKTPIDEVDNQQSDNLIINSPIMDTKSSIMNTTMESAKKATGKATAHTQVAAVTLVHVLFGTAHFIAQSTADMICYSEAKIVHGINAHKESVEEIMAMRRKQTKDYQQNVLKIPAKLKESSAELRARILASRDNSVNVEIVS
jgi:hypothetical protein